MYRSNGRLVVSPTDLVGHIYCRHLTTLAAQVAKGDRPLPERDDPELEVLSRRGIDHERAYLERLEAEGLGVVRIEGDGRDEAGLRAMAAATAEAMRAGAEVIYQAAFLDEGGGGPAWRGHADFLRRVEVPSALGSHSYEPEDAKLARRVRPSAILQLCNYAGQLERVQGRSPSEIHVVLGGGDRRSFRLSDFSAAYRAAARRFEDFLATGAETYPMPVAHCSVCPWKDDCEQRWAEDDELWLVAGLSVAQAEKLDERGGITTVAELAAAGEVGPVGIGRNTLERLRLQARLQVEASENPDRPPPYRAVTPVTEGRGLASLPAPSPGDVFFDIEGDPYVGDGGVQYLLGVGWWESGSFRYLPLWGNSPAEERRSLEAFVDLVTERRARYPDLHVYHYAPYERTALGELAGRHGTREDEVDDLLRNEVLVDLHRVLRQGVTVGVRSYSLKKIEALYMARRPGPVSDGGSSIVEYERWLDTGEESILAAIESYNRDDCDSTRLLRDWLEERRQELVDAGQDVERPAPIPREPPEPAEASDAEVPDLADALAAGVEPPLDWEAERHLAGSWLLAQLLGWHRREEKPEWWRYFWRLEATEEELFDDPDAVARLDYEGAVGHVARSTIHRYRFDPAQECRLGAGQQVVDPEVARERIRTGHSRAGPGSVYDIDSVAGRLDLKRAKTSDASHPRAVAAAGPVVGDPQRQALERIGRSVLENGIEGPGPYRAVRDLVLRRPPRVAGCEAGESLRRPGEDSVTAAARLALALEESCLPVQGPPGSGKTYAGARMARDLVRSGRRVGITANSHAVISNLLDELVRCVAEDSGPSLRIMQKADEGQGLDRPEVELTGSNEAIEAAVLAGEVDVVAGTPWLFSREALAGRFDHLVVDEAGQLSLANVVAAGQAAENLVLIGDPRQLAQPSKGSHPPGAGVSALEHLLAGDDTVPDDRGLFLDRTRRLHPDICRFVSETSYSGRLTSFEGCGLRSVGGDDTLGGSGLRFCPVDHEGCSTASEEEATAVEAVYRSLLGREWTDADGASRVIGPADLLVVAPYNAQVALLADRLGDEAVVGTVDRFQGREAPVVIVSMTASRAETVPRGMEFLYSRNRLNVAVSRARALAVMVASPALLDAPCRSVPRLALLNGLCRYVELAVEVDAGSLVSGPGGGDRRGARRPARATRARSR